MILINGVIPTLEEKKISAKRFVVFPTRRGYLYHWEELKIERKLTLYMAQLFLLSINVLAASLRYALL